MREASVLVTNKNIFALERESDGIFPLENPVLRRLLFQNVTDPIAAMPPKTGRPFLNFRVGFLFWLLRGLLIEHSGKVLRHRGLEEHAHQLTNADVADVCLERQFSYFFI
jgi:hypothetical protein